MNENDIPRCSKLCCRTKRAIEPGEVYYSVLVEEKSEIVRRDYSQEAWKEEQERNHRIADASFIGWWRSILPLADDKKPRLAPNDILFNLFDQWLGCPDKEEYLYILTLLMTRRRLLRMERNDLGQKEMTVYAPRREMSYTIPIRVIPEERIGELQETFAELIYSDNGTAKSMQSSASVE